MRSTRCPEFQVRIMRSWLYVGAWPQLRKMHTCWNCLMTNNLRKCTPAQMLLRMLVITCLGCDAQSLLSRKLTPTSAR